MVPFLLVVHQALAFLVAEDLLPTGGALGILAACCLAFLLFLGFSDSTGAGLRYLAIEVVTVPLGFAASSFLIARTGLGRIASLRPPEIHEVDPTAGGPDLDRLVGLEGRALTPLRPSGMVDFEGCRLEGLAEEGLIPPASRVPGHRGPFGPVDRRASPEGASPGLG